MYMHPIFMNIPAEATNRSLVTLPCVCATLRRTTRAVTQLYDQALRPLGLRATQFTILQVMERTGEITQGRIGELLVADTTTLTRNLQIMRRNGWIAERRGDDRRERWLRLAKPGRALLARATPTWERKQSHLAGTLGEGSWRALFKLTGELTGLAATQGDLS
jgi:DNA-binding MarR family transcriptional regulator